METANNMVTKPQPHISHHQVLKMGYIRLSCWPNGTHRKLPKQFRLLPKFVEATLHN